MGTATVLVQFPFLLLVPVLLCRFCPASLSGELVDSMGSRVPETILVLESQHSAQP